VEPLCKSCLGAVYSTRSRRGCLSMCIEVRVGDGGCAEHVGDLHAHEIDRFCHREIDGAGAAVEDRLTFDRVGVGAPFESAGKQTVWYPAQWP
jgi:hypothetical protein